jgi:hypothetical protein
MMMMVVVVVGGDYSCASCQITCGKKMCLMPQVSTNIC